MNSQKLYIILTDQYNNKIFNGFIAHLDACPSYTLCYLSEFIADESKVVRLIEKIQTIKVTRGEIAIYYQSGATLQIIRKSIA